MSLISLLFFIFVSSVDNRARSSEGVNDEHLSCNQIRDLATQIESKINSNLMRIESFEIPLIKLQKIYKKHYVLSAAKSVTTGALLAIPIGIATGYLSFKVVGAASIYAATGGISELAVLSNYFFGTIAGIAGFTKTEGFVISRLSDTSYAEDSCFDYRTAISNPNRCKLYFLAKERIEEFEKAHEEILKSEKKLKQEVRDNAYFYTDQMWIVNRQMEITIGSIGIRLQLLKIETQLLKQDLIHLKKSRSEQKCNP